jgi:predicted dehydrogenase
VIRLGIVGCNYGRTVLLPAFRADRRCEVVALAGSDPERTRALARESGIARGHARWDDLVADPSVDAVAIATPPRLQPEIAIRALANGKHVFAEKPLAPDIDGAVAILSAARASKKAVMVDFEFAELPAWCRAKAMIDGGALGALRHVVVSWQVENRATQLRLKSWKTSTEQGGGALGNLVSHCLYYLEHFCGPIRDLSARTFGLPGEDTPKSSVSMCGAFASGAAYMLSMSAASHLGSGHRIEFYGEDGTLVLWNATSDYMRGFRLLHARRPAAALDEVGGLDEPDSYPDGRIAPVARLVVRFIDAIENGTEPSPGITAGVRVQTLIDAARRSHAGGGAALAVNA